MADVVTLESLRLALGEDLSPVVLRTGDRGLFKRCRRLWGWLSHHRQGRVLRENADYLWFGTGVHYALEDYHGLNLYSHPTKAFVAYVQASKIAGILPGTWQELQVLGTSIMSYYADQWLACRPALDTYVVDGVPQVEVNGVIDLDIKAPDGRPVVYGFTIDRMVIDEDGRLWIVEYKTAKQIRLYHFDVDEQITSYCWAAWRLYGKPVAGVVYQQFRKDIPALPKVLATGKVSTDLRQNTSAAMYELQLKDMYGTVASAPPENIQCYNKLRAMEDEDRDRFIVRHRIERNEHQLLSFEERVKMEIEEMTNPNVPLYPHPTASCDYACPLLAACVAMEDGSDWQSILDIYSRAPDAEGLTQREKEQAQWRTHLPEPADVTLSLEGQQYEQLLAGLTKQMADHQPSPEELLLEELGMS